MSERIPEHAVVRKSSAAHSDEVPLGSIGTVVHCYPQSPRVSDSVEVEYPNGVFIETESDLEIVERQGEC